MPFSVFSFRFSVKTITPRIENKIKSGQEEILMKKCTHRLPSYAKGIELTKPI